MAAEIKEADDGSVEINLEPDNSAAAPAPVPEGSPSPEAAKAPAQPVPGTPPAPSEKKEEYSAAVAGRIGNLTKKWRETERERDEALRLFKLTQDENDRLRKRTFESDSNVVAQAESRIDAQILAAKRAVAEAYTLAEGDKIAEATSTLGALNAERDRILLAKNSISPDQYQAPPVHHPVQQVQGPDEKAVAWQEKNPWFGKDRAMTGAAYGIHEELINSGVDPQSDDYYESLNARMGEYFPTKFKPSEKTAQETPVRPDPAGQVVSAPSREPPGPPTKRNLRLTPSQVRVAKRLGVPLDRYAEEFVKLEQQ